MPAPAPTFRGQTTELFRTDTRDKAYKRGQTVPYGTNGAPPASEPGYLAISINDLPLADAAEPLFEVLVMLEPIVFTGNEAISAGIAASAPTAFPIYKNGLANGDVTITGASGVLTLSDSSYGVGDLFAIYPPVSPDATLDQVRMSLEVA